MSEMTHTAADDGDQLQAKTIDDINELFEGLDQEEADELRELYGALEQLQSCLDSMEQQNDTIYSRLNDLLQSNREIRKELEEQRLAAQQALDSVMASSSSPGAEAAQKGQTPVKSANESQNESEEFQSPGSETAASHAQVDQQPAKETV